jgi:hypothetical protein
MNDVSTMLLEQNATEYLLKLGYCYGRVGATAAVYMKSSFFWDVTQGTLVISYRRFGTTYRSHLQGLLDP